MKKFLAAILILGFLFTGCGSENPKPKPVTEVPKPVTETTTPVEKIEKPVESVSNLPTKISNLPGIGSTRAEFEKHHVKSNEYGKNRIAYDNDTILVDFYDSNWKESKSMDSRAWMIVFQSLPERRLNGINIEDYIPLDAENFEQTNHYKDSMMTMEEYEGYSSKLEKIFPTWKGKFGVGTTYDTPTGDFIGATFSAM